jgi:hypothetical protein
MLIPDPKPPLRSRPLGQDVVARHVEGRGMSAALSGSRWSASPGSPGLMLAPPPGAGMPGSPGLILRHSPPCRQSRASRPIAPPALPPAQRHVVSIERLALEAPRRFAGLDACRPPPISPPSSTPRWWSPGSGSCCIGEMIDAPPALRRGPWYAESGLTKGTCGWQLYP